MPPHSPDRLKGPENILICIFFNSFHISGGTDIKKSDTDIVGQQNVGFGSVRIGNTESRIRIPKKSDILSDIGYLKIQTFLDSILTFYCIFSHKIFTVTNHSTKICKILLFLEKRKKKIFFQKISCQKNFVYPPT